MTDQEAALAGAKTLWEGAADAVRRVPNRHHNGYPELLVQGEYPGDAVELPLISSLQTRLTPNWISEPPPVRHSLS